MLDNVIDLNFYPTKEAENSNLQHRPIGLGLMGYHDVLHILNINIDSKESCEFSDILFEHYSKNAIEASSKLAAERGAYGSYAGSLWDQGIFPINSYNDLMNYRGQTDLYRRREFLILGGLQGFCHKIRHEKLQRNGYSSHRYYRLH